MAPPYKKIEEIESLDDPERWFDNLDEDTEFAAYDAEREQRLKRTALLRNSVIVRNIKQTDQLVSELAEVLKPDSVTLGLADEDDIRHRDDKVAEVQFNAKQEDAVRFQHNAAEIEKLEQRARQRVLDQLAKKEQTLKSQAEDAVVRDKARQEHLNKTLRAAEYKLQAALSVRKGELQTTYGTMGKDKEYTKFATEQKPPTKKVFIGKKDRDKLCASPPPHLESVKEYEADQVPTKYKVDWAKAPQPLRVHLDLCRAVKDKLPQGQYVLMISVWNRLGGHRLQWSSLQHLEDRSVEGQGPKKSKSMLRSVTDLLDDSRRRAKELNGAISTSSAVTAPVAHSGLWYSDVMRFDQTLYLACPPEKDVTPSMCLVFELYLLRGQISPVDKVMAWGAFPLVDSDFQLIRGCFKLPLLRGAVDRNVDMYSHYERLYREDIQAWLCNLYFRCDRMPKYTAGQLEYEVLLNYTGNLLSLKKQARRDNLTHQQLKEKAGRTVMELKKALEEPHDVFSDDDDAMMKDGVRAKKTKGNDEDVYKPLVNTEDFDQYQYSVTSGHTLVRDNELWRKGKYISDEVFGDFVVSTDVRDLVCVLLYASLAGNVGSNLHPLPRTVAHSLRLQHTHVPVRDFLRSRVRGICPGPTDDRPGAACRFVRASHELFDLPDWIAHHSGGSGVCWKNSQSRFFPAYGLAVTLDPIVNLIIDALAGNWTGDAFKLFNLYSARDDNGIMGIIFTFLLYVAFTALSVITFYYYIIQIHHYGRVKDTHRRLSADEVDFFVPLDWEVSLRYLKWVCYKAKVFRGTEGQTRDIQVTEFIVDREDRPTVKKLAKLADVAAAENEEADTDCVDVGIGLRHLFRTKRSDSTTYFCIHTVDPNSRSRSLYRHFMKYPNGAIVELSPKEAAKLMAEKKPGSTVTKVTHDPATGATSKTEDVPVTEWLLESFGNLPPLITTGAEQAALMDGELPSPNFLHLPMPPAKRATVEAAARKSVLVGELTQEQKDKATAGAGGEQEAVTDTAVAPSDKDHAPEEAHNDSTGPFTETGNVERSVSKASSSLRRRTSSQIAKSLSHLTKSLSHISESLSRRSGSQHSTHVQDLSSFNQAEERSSIRNSIQSHISGVEQQQSFGNPAEERNSIVQGLQERNSVRNSIQSQLSGSIEQQRSFGNAGEERNSIVSGEERNSVRSSIRSHASGEIGQQQSFGNPAEERNSIIPGSQVRNSLRNSIASHASGDIEQQHSFGNVGEERKSIAPGMQDGDDDQNPV
ncbi:transmembrane protein [Cystoisospora suis]|uniref:Transmembrane protein n=1 Tax=Cystoisospora suis TaxID=483139 RepID=A0A2C6JMK1_9APIC|nr:transmembrane protein [Cystoisospora suis]